MVPVAEDELERELVAVTREYRSGRPAPGLAQRISLAGAQPKLARHRGSDGVWYRPTGGHPTTHILKPIQQNGYDDLDLVEYLTMQAAGHLGITAADTELMQIGGSHVFVTRRYDRRIIDGRWHRIHQEDLCQALSVAPEKKYQRADGGPGVARIGQLFRALPQPVDRRLNAA